MKNCIRPKINTGLILHFALAFGLGLGISSYITFFSFIFFSRLNKTFIIGCHIALLLFLLTQSFTQDKKKSYGKTQSFYPKSQLLYFLILLIPLYPLFLQAKNTPFGGWDAWAVWNFKAKFLFLSQNNWQNIFDPILWRSSPHYPLLLPLINVWTWIFLSEPLNICPLITSLLFVFLTVALVAGILLKNTPKLYSIIASLILLSLPYFGKLGTSQYGDIVLGFYLLASIYCLIEIISSLNIQYAVLAGLFLGFLSFTKSEGLVAALLLFSFGFGLSYLNNRNNQQDNIIYLKKCLAFLIAGFILSLLPNVIFHIYYSPGNQTFINGIISKTKPSSLYRLKMIFAFFLMELKSKKWDGIWILLGLGMLLSHRQCFRKKIIIIPLFIFTYLFIVFTYYFINTHFEITWWLQVSLSRILFSLLPLAVFWIFISLKPPKSPAPKS